MSWFIVMLNIFELFACITGFLFWNKIKNTYWKWFPVYLGIIFLTEVIAEYFLNVRKDLQTNNDLYNYFGIPVQFFFFYWLFYQEFKKTKISLWPLISAAIYFLILVVDLVFLSNVKFYFESLSYIVGCTFLLILLIMFFLKFIKSEELINYKYSMMFWVCSGLMLFYIGSLPYWVFRTKMYQNSVELFYVYNYVQFGLNYLMYFLFIVSFIWAKPR